MQQSVAIVHDWLTSMRGGERVVEALCKIFPRADLFTLTWDPKHLSPQLAKRRTTTSLVHDISRAPFVNGRFRALLPIFPLAIESFDLDRYALVVSSSHCVAMGAIAPAHALHVAYIHSTLRYVREAQSTYEASVPGGPVGRALFRGMAHYLRRWETRASARPHVLIANSTFTRERIRGYYGREASVIEPPIETTRFERAARAVAPRKDAPFLLVSALVPNKRVDLAVRAFQGRPERLLVVGEGPERARLERLLGPNVTLMPRVGEAELEGLYAGCRALLHTAVDDFGMVMAEALAAGRPVIAAAEGGALDIVRDGETGLLIESPTVEAIRMALDRFALVSGQFEPAALQRFARRFDRSVFEDRFATAVEDAWRAREEAGKDNGSVGGLGRTTTNGANGSGRMNASANGTNGTGEAHRHALEDVGAHGKNGQNGGHSATGLHNGTQKTNGQNGAHAAGPRDVEAREANGSGVNGAKTPMTNGNGGHHAVDHGKPCATHGSNGANGTHGANGTNGAHARNGNGSAHGHSHERAVPHALVVDTAHAAKPNAPVTDPDLVARWLARHPRAALTAKRVADVTFATAGLALTTPLMVALGALIVLESDGPALFFQRRTGLDQRPFTLIKLRTMDGTGNVTRLGRFLRPMGLDELPQLWNVLKGDMSLIGPRPEVPDRVERFEENLPGYRARHLMRPGITGWAQVNGLRGNKSPIAERLRFDIQYLHDWSLPFDGRILTRTVSTVLSETIRSLRT